MTKINHRDLEMCIGVNENCDSHLNLKVAGFYSNYNNIIVAAKRGEDKFFLASRDRKTDILEAVLLDSRYLIIGSLKDVDERIFKACVPHQGASWIEIPVNNLYISRLLIAGAIRIISVIDKVSPSILQTLEYQQALGDKRVIEVIC